MITITRGSDLLLPFLKKNRKKTYMIIKSLKCEFITPQQSCTSKYPKNYNRTLKSDDVRRLIAWQVGKMRGFFQYVLCDWCTFQKDFYITTVRYNTLSIPKVHVLNDPSTRDCESSTSVLL